MPAAQPQCPEAENGHGDESGAVSTGPVDGGIYAAVRNTETKCYRALYWSRWATGFRCPVCGGRAATQAHGVRGLNVRLGNIKRAISGCYHAIKQAKYARRYLAEAAYRFNRRCRLTDMLS